MPAINRFNQPIQTATFQPMNLQELSLAPSMLAQREEKSLDQADALSAIDVNRLQGDEELVSGKLGDLRTKISKLSERLASEGYNKDIANQLRRVKTEYATELGPTGTLGRAQANYQAANEQWRNVEQDLRRQGATQRDIEINKQQFFSGYKGMRDDLGNLQDFTSGRTAGYFDVRKEAMDLFRQAQDRGELVGVNPNEIGIKPINVPGVGPMLKIVNSRTGQVISNTESLSNAITSLFNEYTSPETQRGFYARSTGLSPEYLGRTFKELADVYKSSKYAQIPYEDINYQNAPKETSGDIGDIGAVALVGTADVPKYGGEGTSARAAAMDKLAIEKAKSEGIANINSYQDLQQEASKTLAINKQTMDKLVNEYIINNPEEITAARGTRLYDLQKGRVVSKVIKDLEITNPASKVIRDIQNIVSDISEEGVENVYMYDINSLALASGKTITELDKLKSGLNTALLSSNKNKFVGIDPKQNKVFEEIKNNTKDLEVLNYSYTESQGVILTVKGTKGKGEDKEEMEAVIKLPDSYIPTETIFVDYIGQLHPGLSIIWNKRRSKYKK